MTRIEMGLRPISIVLLVSLMRRSSVGIVLGAAVCAAGLAFALILVPYGIEEGGGISKRAISPALWPRIISIALVVLGAIATAQAVLGRTLVARAGGAEEERVQFAASPRVPFAMVALFAYWFVIPILGMPLASALAILVFVGLFEEYRLAVMIPLAVGLPVLLYLFFTRVTNIPIPLGMFET